MGKIYIKYHLGKAPTPTPARVKEAYHLQKSYLRANSLWNGKK
jgi:hypothetical protein